MSHTNTEKILKQARADCILGKKKHFNAADRKRKYSRRMSCAIIATDILSGSVLFYHLTSQSEDFFTIISLLLILFSAFLTTLRSHLKYENIVEGHCQVGNSYLKIAKYINATLALIDDNCLNEEDLQKRMDKILGDCNESNSMSEKFPTNTNDFEVARSGIKNGEEEYTEKDMALWQ